MAGGERGERPLDPEGDRRLYLRQRPRLCEAGQNRRPREQQSELKLQMRRPKKYLILKGFK